MSAFSGTFVRVVNDGMKGAVESIRQIAENKLLIGIPSEKNKRDDPMTNATLGYIHENGSAAAHIPARPFLKPGVEKCRDKIIVELKNGATAGLNGNTGAMEKAMNRAGLLAQNEVREYITKGEGFEPLATQTIEARKRAGKSGTKPLIRTGQLRRSITYVIRRK